MSARHLVWRTNPGKKYCGLQGLRNVPRQFEINRGISRAHGFPADAHFTMNKAYPKQVAVSDSLENMDDMVVVSAALRDFVETQAPRSLEILPVRIINHKGRDVGQPFWILNPLEIVDCIDQAASKVRFGALDPTEIVTYEKLMLDPSAIPADLLLFRPKFLEGAVMVRRDVADAIVAKGFTGLAFIEIDQFRA